MLGRGRPFILEISNPHKVFFSAKQYLEMENEVNRSTKMIQIQDLQRVSK